MLYLTLRCKNLKVHMFPQGNKQVPAVRVAGDWLKEFGFQPGEQVVLAAQYGKIVISRAQSAIAERSNDELA